MQQGTIGAGEEGPGLSDGPVSFLNMDLGDSDPDDSSFG